MTINISLSIVVALEKLYTRPWYSWGRKLKIPPQTGLDKNLIGNFSGSLGNGLKKIPLLGSTLPPKGLPQKNFPVEGLLKTETLPSGKNFPQKGGPLFGENSKNSQKGAPPPL